MDVCDGLEVYVLADDYAGYSSPFIAQHGLSLLLKIEYNNEVKYILFDTGTYAKPILFNMKLLQINPSVIDVIVLSHCHYDHTGGLTGILKKIRKEEVPIITYPDIFRPHLVLKPHVMHVGIPRKCSKEHIEKLGGKWIFVKESFNIIPCVIYSGEIREIEEFEKSDIELYTVKNGELVKDPVRDEVAIAVNTKKGLVIIVGCSHPGIISITKYFKKITGTERIEAIIGGLHLVNANEDRIKKTIEELNNMNVRNLYIGHCTGLRAEAEVLRSFKGNFKKLYSGMKIIL
mgnify:CR=1 FL=1